VWLPVFIMLSMPADFIIDEAMLMSLILDMVAIMSLFDVCMGIALCMLVFWATAGAVKASRIAASARIATIFRNPSILNHRTNDTRTQVIDF
jgi:hypothetical protein